MKRRGWLLLGCSVILSTALLQPVLAHDRGYDDYYGYGRPMVGGPGFPGGHPYGYQNDHCDRERQNGSDMSHGMRHGMRQLDLGDEQDKAIHKILRDSRSDFRKIEEKIRDKRYDLYDLIAEGKDSNKIDALADEIGDLMADRIKQRAAVRIRILQLLTPEQRDEARDIPFLGR